VAARLLNGPASRPVYFINRRGGLVHGRHAYSSLRELPDPVDLVVLAVPASGFEQAVDEALAAGAKALVVISTGLGEMGREGRMREQSVVARVRAAGAVMIGPNCPGIADTTSGLSGLAFLDVPPGPIGFISQSGGVGEEIVVRVQEVAQGFTHYVTLGNQADVGIADVVWSFVGHEPTCVVAVYAEDLNNGRQLAVATAALVASGTPLLLLAPGRSEASIRAARSHTGSLTSDAAVIDAFCRTTGALRVETPGELVGLAAGLLSGRTPAGRRLAIVSDGGGHAAIAGDAAHVAGLEVPRFTESLAARLREILPANASTSNPVDFALASTDARVHASVASILAESGEIDALHVGGEFGFSERGFRTLSARSNGRRRPRGVWQGWPALPGSASSPPPSTPVPQRRLNCVPAGYRCTGR
jgi:acyl-CoA synthetase (NDP forming)